jgi:2-dehydro-3-deoxyphosphogluconate aldolase/(4S)-4-hydroxy-2-oxoglutarate aldolase
MNIEQSWKRIGEVGIVPVIRAANAEEARQAVQAIYAGGISIVEITTTVPKAITAIRDVVRQYGDKLLVGAGTVLDYEQASECLDAGAEFLVSPGLSLPVLKAAQARGKLAIPGALTPSEVMSATREGARLVKIFPCESVGGPKYIKALKGPFPQVDLIPTGGVNVLNAGDYFAAGSFALGIGSELVNLKALRAGNSQDISNIAVQLVEVVSHARQAQQISTQI